MRAVVAVALGALLALPGAALAQSSGGDATCGQVLADAVPGCAEVVLAENALKKQVKQQTALKKLADDATKPAADREAAQRALNELNPQIEEAEKALEELKDTPFEELAGFCLSLSASTPRTCDALATRLGAFDEESLKPIGKAAKEKGEEGQRALVREAAASDRRTANNKGGSSAQVDPVESVQPITVAGGAFTLSGTRAGSKGVGTISVNPLALAVPDDVAAARLLDLSVSAPFDLAGGTANREPYISARLRVNITAPFSAADLQKAVDVWLNAAGIYADKLEKALANAKDPEGCANYVAQFHRASASACEQDVSSDEMRQARVAAYAAMASARRAADRYYVGVDARFDTGDPTGPNVGNDLGTHALGGLAAGVRIPQGSSLWDWELRGRFAGDYFKARDAVAGAHVRPVGSLDWGAAVIFSGRVQESAKQRMAFGVGAEGRHAPSKSESAKSSPTNFVSLNLMAVVPAVTGGDLGLAIGIPLWELREVRGVMVNFSTDLGLLDHSL